MTTHALTVTSKRAPRFSLAAGWVVLLLLVAATLAAGPYLNGPLRMFAGMTAMMLGFKIMTLPRQRKILYMLWPGTDPRPFEMPRTPDYTGCSILARGCATMAIGVCLLLAPVTNPLAKAWLAIAGMLALFHMGLFDVMAGLLRWNGIPVERICPSPWLSRSLAEFWSARWNRAFHVCVRDCLYRPLARRWGRTAALITVFLFSGLAHELVISFPAGAGWGLPTLYFTLHGIAVEFEKRKLIRGRWLTTVALVLLPLPILFHGPFMANVVLPLVRP